MNWALVNSSGIIKNLIVYNDDPDFLPDGGLTLMRVNPWLSIGQHIDAPRPTE